MTSILHPFRRHAVEAAQVTAVGYRQTQIVDLAAMAVFQSHGHSACIPTVVSSTSTVTVSPG